VQGYLVDVICDTSFLIHLATKRIRNIDKIDEEIGQIDFVVPEVVENEILKLITKPEKNKEAMITKNYIKNFKTISISGNFADKELINYVKSHKGIIGTMDKELKIQIKNAGGSVLSFSNNRIVLES
jgi:rRNA-processing protein FCF1